MILQSPSLDDVEYFRRRAIEEQVAAGRACCDEVRRKHDELAMLYRFRAAMLSSGPHSWAMSLDFDPDSDRPSASRRQTSAGVDEA